MTTANIDINKTNSIISDIREYQQLSKELDAQIEALKDQLKAMLVEADLEEISCDAGHATYRNVQSSRFMSTEFKKVHPDLAAAFTTTTTYKRLTVN